MTSVIETSLSETSVDDIIRAADPRDPLAGLIDEPGWAAAADDNRFVTASGKRPVPVSVGMRFDNYNSSLGNSYAAAVTTARTITNDPGVGVILGPSLSSHNCQLIVLDCDKVRDAKSGVIKPQVLEALRRLLTATYSEVSVSGMGIHVIPWLDQEDRDKLSKFIASRKKSGQSIDSISLGGHGDLYARQRYVRLTGNRFAQSPPDPRLIPFETLENVLLAFIASNDDAPSQAQSGVAPAAPAPRIDVAPIPLDLATLSPELRAAIEAKATDGGIKKTVLEGRFAHPDDQSDNLLALVGAMLRAGMPEDMIWQMARIHPACADHVALNGDRAIQRGFDKAVADMAAVIEAVMAPVDDVAAALGAIAPQLSPTGPALSALGEIAVQKGSGLRIRTADELINMPPLKWLIEGLVPEKSLVVVSGQAKNGKSFVVGVLTYALAIGASFAGKPAREPLRCDVWLGEGVAGTGARIAALREYYGQDCGDRLNFLTGPWNSAEYIKLRKDNPPDVIVLDTMWRAFPGRDENSGMDMGTIIAEVTALLEVLGLTVILVAHTGKSRERGIRGHSSLGAAVDVNLEVTKTSTGKMILTIAAIKDAEESPPVFFELEKIGASAVAVMMPPGADTGPSGEINLSFTPVERAALAALKAVRTLRSMGVNLAYSAASTGQNSLTGSLDELPSSSGHDPVRLSSDEAAPQGAITMNEWRVRFHESRPKLDKEVNARALKRAVKSLKDKGIISTKGEWVTVSLDAEGAVS